MSQEKFTCVGLYRGKAHPLFHVDYDTDTSDFAEICRLIARGFEDQASDFEFAAIVDEYEPEGTDDDGPDSASG